MIATATATAAERPAVCRLLFAHSVFATAAAARLEQCFASGELDPDGLLVAKRGGAVCGAILAHRLGGAQAAVWLPVADDAATQDALVAGAVAWVHREPTKLIQAIVRRPELLRTDALVRGGFRHVTRLVYLRRDLSRAAEPVSSELRFYPATPATPGFADRLVQTYEGTLDIPELNGCRAGEEVLASYRTGQTDDPPNWWRIEWHGEDIGVLLMSATDEATTMELTYLGILPAYRGRGFGTQTLARALKATRTMGAQAVTLNVDVRNEPALRLYRSKHFQEFDVREVFLCFPIGHSAK